MLLQNQPVRVAVILSNMESEYWGIMMSINWIALFTILGGLGALMSGLATAWLVTVTLRQLKASIDRLVYWLNL